MTSAVLSEIPVQLSHFVGRERELAHVTELLASTRLLTLTGAGGSGKTRIAEQAARRAAPDGPRIGWVDLAVLSDEAQLTQHVARALRVPESMERPTTDALVEELADARTLLILDNCEHVVDSCAALVETLLRACPQLSLLTTSREPLGVPSETAWLVPPLASEEAIRLFVERARGSLATFELTEANAGAVHDICQRLDGLPLAIELAAARVRTLTPAQIVERLDGAFRLLNTGHRTALPRHRTLRGTMDWSYQLLSPREQALMARLSVFAGSFSLDAAERICCGGVCHPGDVLDALSALVDKSLVVMEAGETEARYRLLETVRQYADERLDDSDERAATHAAHAEYFTTLAEALEPRLTGGENERGLAALVHRDGANFRAACAWSLGDPARVTTAARLAGALFWYWYSIAAFIEERAFVDAVLARLPEDAPARLVGRVEMTRGFLDLSFGCGSGSRMWLGRAYARLTEAGAPLDERLIAQTKRAAGHLLDGDAEGALALLVPIRDAALRSERVIVRGFWQFWSGWAYLMSGQLAEARAQLDDGLSLGREYEHDTMLAHGAVLLGRVALIEGRFDEGLEHLREALVHHRMMGEGWGITLGADSLAKLASDRGLHAEAVELQAATDALRARHGMAIPPADAADRAVVMDSGRLALGEAAFAARVAAGATLSRHALVDLALTRVIDALRTPHEPSSMPVAGASSGIFRAQAVARLKLRVQALGALQISIGDQSLDGTAWGSSRARELFVFLLLHPEGVTKEQVGLALWPEASTMQLRNSFHVTLHRLRKALGNGDLIHLDGERYGLAPTAMVWFDAREFEKGVVAGRRALAAGNETGEERVMAALDLYRGPLLDGEPIGDWHDPFRDRLQVLYLAAAMDLGTALLADQRHERAADVFRRVLHHDALHEVAARGLMTTLARTGERGQAVRTYERLASMLRRELEAEPDGVTSALVGKIQRGEAV